MQRPSSQVYILCVINVENTYKDQTCSQMWQINVFTNYFIVLSNNNTILESAELEADSPKISEWAIKIREKENKIGKGKRKIFLWFSFVLSKKEFCFRENVINFIHIETISDLREVELKICLL